MQFVANLSLDGWVLHINWTARNSTEQHRHALLVCNHRDALNTCYSDAISCALFTKGQPSVSTLVRPYHRPMGGGRRNLRLGAPRFPVVFGENELRGSKTGVIGWAVCLAARPPTLGGWSSYTS